MIGQLKRPRYWKYKCLKVIGDGESLRFARYCDWTYLSAKTPVQELWYRRQVSQLEYEKRTGKQGWIIGAKR